MYVIPGPKRATLLIQSPYLVLQSLSLPTANKFNLTSFNFDDEPLSDDDTVMASVRMFIDRGLMKQFKISKRVSTLILLLIVDNLYLLCWQTVFTWVMTVKKNYRKVFYHNWRHAFAVAQSMFAVFSVRFAFHAQLS